MAEAHLSVGIACDSVEHPFEKLKSINCFFLTQPAMSKKMPRSLQPSARTFGSIPGVPR